MPKHEPSGEFPANVSVSGGQGIQAGTKNTQINNWQLRQPLDPAFLGALNPHTAVARLQQLSHDELVDFFARASPPEDVSEILATFLEADQAKVVAVLADINRRKVTGLIAAFGPDHFLANLPEAAHEIARKAAGLRWTDAGPLEAFLDGYARRYKDGRVFWSRVFGTRTTAGAIDDCWMASGLTFGFGFPTGDQETASASPSGTEGSRQEFQLATAYSSRHGTFLVEGVMCYQDLQGSSGWLGFPIGQAKENPHFGRQQQFEGGSIYSLALGQRAFAVARGTDSVLPDSQEWCPTSNETATVSSSGMRGTVQQFELAVRQGDETYTAVEVQVYFSAENGIVLVVPEAGSYYNKLGAEKSWLGFPVEPARPALGWRPGKQIFEEGVIYWRPGAATIAIPRAVVDLIAQDPDLGGRLGLPVSEEQPAGEDGSGRIQFFEDGVITLRDGKREIWLRPGATGDHRPRGE
jgi:uncharacterized protein with LGFP repeats